MPRFPLLRLPLQRRARRRRIMTLLIALTILVFVPTVLYSVYKPPRLLILSFQHLWPQVLWRVSLPRSGPSSKLIALTIDDGPSEYTKELLSILSENSATATWFIIGAQIPSRESTLQSIVRNGNELGNHAMRDEPSRSLSDATLAAQMETVDASLAAAYAAVDKLSDRQRTPPRYFRPGSGFFSQRMIRLTQRLGYRIVLGNVYPHDPQIAHPRVNARHILSMVRPGSIVICHDRRPWTAPMLRIVLPELKRRGYRVVTVTELLRQGEKVDKGGKV